jgi:hypothetical protein
MLRRILGIARGRAMRGGTGAARPGMGGPRPGPAAGPRAGRMGRPGRVGRGPAGGNAEIQRGVRSIMRGMSRRRGL